MSDQSVQEVRSAEGQRSEAQRPQPAPRSDRQESPPQEHRAAAERARGGPRDAQEGADDGPRGAGRAQDDHGSPRGAGRAQDDSPRGAGRGEEGGPRRYEPAEDQETRERRQASRERTQGPPDGLLKGILGWGADAVGGVVDSVQDRQRDVQVQHRTEWGSRDDISDNLRRNPDLTTYSDQQLRTLAAVRDPQLRQQVQRTTARFVNDRDSLEGLPQGTGFQSLLQHQLVNYKPSLAPGTSLNAATHSAPDVVQRAQEHLRGLVDSHVRSSFDAQLEGQEGEEGVDTALAGWREDLAAGAARNPGLQSYFLDSATALAYDSETEGRLDDVVEAGRSTFDKALDGAFSSAAGTVPGLGLAMDGPVADLRSQVVGDAAGWLGQAADDVITAPGGGGIVGPLFGQDADADLRGGLGNLANSTITGVGDVLADPGPALRGIAEMALRNPTTAPARALLNGQSVGEELESDQEFWERTGDAFTEPYAETAEEHGTLGAVTHILGDVALTVGTGGGTGAVKGAAASGRLGSRLAKLVDDWDSALATARHGAIAEASRLPAGVGDVAQVLRYPDLIESIPAPLRRLVERTRSKTQDAAEAAAQEEDD